MLGAWSRMYPDVFIADAARVIVCRRTVALVFTDG